MNVRIRLVALPAAVLLATGCMGSAGAGASLSGSVVVGPMCPTGSCPDKAVPNVQVIFTDPGGKTRDTAVTDSKGNFSVSLPQGLYSIRLHGVNPVLPQFGSTDLHPTIGPTTIQARPGDRVDLKFRIFSGIA